MTVPHLATALTGPVLDLEQRILDARPAIEHWFRVQWQEHGAPFYASVDLRNAGFKLAPVDTNLFPGGFNNLDPSLMPLCVQAAMFAVEKICPDSQRLMLIPESHTRNLFYLQNVAVLKRMLEGTGLQVRIGSLIPDLEGPTTIELPNGDAVLLEPVRREDNRLKLENFDPCAVLLNNDLSGGVPPQLQGLEQMILPPLEAGWSVRRKSRHFAAYAQVTAAFAELVGIDPWLIDPYYAVCTKVDFQARVGEDCLAGHVADIIERTAEKYRQYGIREHPFAVVKADAGTYGMGIMMVKSADEVRALNRKQRNKMAVIKEGQKVSDVLIQEGVHTFETVNDAVAEPVVYMIDRHVVGGFYRVHTGRAKDENLNAPGMHFVPLAFETSCTTPDLAARPDAPPNRFYAYGVVARLALLAAAVELEETPAPAQALAA